MYALLRSVARGTMFFVFKEPYICCLRSLAAANKLRKFMPNEENLKPHNFKSGADWKGNKKGRPKGSQNLSTILQKWLKVKEIVRPDMVPLLKKDQNLTQLDIIVLQLIQKARKGDLGAIQELLNRYAGKPVPVAMDEEGNVIGTQTITVEIG